MRRAEALVEALAPWAECRMLVDETEGLGRALEVVRDLTAVALVVDSYRVSPRELEAARGRVRLTVRVDDAGRFPLAADIVVNAALGLAPPPPARGTRYLLGPRFALLGRVFAAGPARPAGRDVERVLVAFGGATPAALVARVAGAVRAALPRAALDVVVGPAGDGAEAVRAALGVLDGVTLRVAPESLRPLMLAADLAVSAGGVTALELAATATPTVAVCLAPNQRTNLDGLAATGALVVAGDADDPRLVDTVRAAVAALAAEPERRRRLGARGRALVDGLGAARVADEMRARLGAATPVGGRPC
ncbi:MAG: hypothetical protein A2X36_05105 [Elusimicrobia bacterium GWA2_69_24]|nr:MAG: hypothetical protein A2W08_17505 [Candidatus Rokubacteria bacterium RBG_16_73_20]OGR61033.1 MAG: hypothetical protein A2X36_05105 [Elusimicrobia bacterium GWA2_69_24]